MKKLTETLNERLLLTVLMTSATMVIAGCSNPADDVSEATVGDAQEIGVAVADAKPFTITAESSIGFTGSKVTGKHDGGFNEFRGVLMVADGKIVPSGSFITIEMNSLWSDTEKLTGHLKDPDFFEVETYPTSVFSATAIEEGSEEEGFTHTITGNLEMKDISKSITFPAKIEVSDEQVTLNAEFSIMRFDWGIEYKGMTNDLVRDEVVIRLDVTARPAEA